MAQTKAPLPSPPLLTPLKPPLKRACTCRQLARLISRHTWLYTEMVVDQTIIHTPFIDKFLWFPPEQHPIVCQLGGSDPTLLARAAAIVERYGYDEINLNCGASCTAGRHYHALHAAAPFMATKILKPQPQQLPAWPAGCPSDRVAGAGCFGAAMMLRPQLVADCCKAMREAVLMPITVKCRLGEPSLLRAARSTLLRNSCLPAPPLASLLCC